MEVLGEELPIDRSVFEEIAGEGLRSLRERRGVDLTEVASAGPYSETKLKLVEKGQITPTETVMLSYSIGLRGEGFTVQDFIEEFSRELLSRSGAA